MSYWNPIARYGPDRFARELAAAGGSGVVTPDLIPDEAAGGCRPLAVTGWTPCSWWRRRRPTSGSR